MGAVAKDDIEKAKVYYDWKILKKAFNAWLFLRVSWDGELSICYCVIGGWLCCGEMAQSHVFVDFPSIHDVEPN